MNTKTFTIELGKYKSAKAYLKALKGFKVGTYAEQLIEKMPIATKEESIDLEVLSVADLGFTSYATGKEIFAKAKELGYELCPAEVGPALRLAYTDQPQYEYLIVAMEPIADSDGDLNVWDIAHDSDGRWLDAYYDVLEGTWDPGRRFIVRRPRKLPLGPSPLVSESLDSFALRISALEKFKEQVEKMLNLPF